jgi:hypothetical protein
VKLDSGTGFSIKDSTGATERLRVDEATGNVSRNGALFVHTTGTHNLFVGPGAGNTATYGTGGNSAFGQNALSSNIIGLENAAFGYAALRANTSSRNSAFGYAALRANTSGNLNSAFGDSALRANTFGYGNTALGAFALYSSNSLKDTAVGSFALLYDTTGGGNSAVGFAALRKNTSGNINSAFGGVALRSNTTGQNNSAFGYGALQYNTTGQGNVAVGNEAGRNQTTGSDNIYLANFGVAAENGRIRIGTSPTHSATFIAGIRGVTTANADAIPVLIDSAGQLGTISSSRTVKKEIRDMGDATARLLELRPVTFRYRQEQTLPGGREVPQEYGLIAEEVAEVFPDLVVYDEKGAPFTVKYHELAPMLLNEMKKQQAEIAALTARLAQLETRN